MEENARVPESERLQMAQILELDMEELQVEEVDDDFEASDNGGDDDDALFRSGNGDREAGPSDGLTFDTSLASLHTYLGEIDDIHGRNSFFDGGTILQVPLLYFEGVVLFPEATLPLRIVDPKFTAAVEKALNQVDAPCTIGVVRAYRPRNNGWIRAASIGTTAEIRQYRRLDNGSLNVVTRGQQRFRLRRHWVDVDGAPFGEIEIVQEDTPLRTPKDAFGQLASVNNYRTCTFSHRKASGVLAALQHGFVDAENDSDSVSSGSVLSDYSEMDTRVCLTGSGSVDSANKNEMFNELSSGEEEFLHGHFGMQQKISSKSSRSAAHFKHEKMNEEGVDKHSPRKELSNIYRAATESNCAFQAPMSFWPRWVYEMYDAYSLARRAAELWRQIIVNPSMDDYIRKPGLLSFYIASKLPLSESTRQELLEIDGISYRLQREIQLLKGFNLLRCKNCEALIAKRSDMVVMSTDGPLNAFVNPNGYVHELITVQKAIGLLLHGAPSKEHSWFPGYAWTVACCAGCESHLGWLFTAVKKNLLPKSFWGIRSSQVADDTKHEVQ
ncbi:protein cereblon isoform X1 [Ananas comosus]|uniref:Protein cereblon n=1 Tax=Ananas comosus TaxID=4615 RepID=A0A6P5FR75_ANACO|nr:protein cereblon isoform X1 [Ananas comosus]